jgi:hypothetical protein
MPEARFLEIASRAYPHLDPDLWKSDHVASGRVGIFQSK